MNAASLRILLSLVLLAVLGTGAWVLFRGRPEPEKPFPARPHAGGGPELRLDSPESCRPCHGREYDEWAASRHALAWTNPQVEAYAVLSLGLDDCVQCHAPQPVFLTGVGRAPKKRAEGRDGGVHCLTCHIGPDGVVGLRGNPDAPCRPSADSRLSSALCASCHRTIGLDWKESDAARNGTGCADCHNRGADGSVTHAMGGGHAPDVLARAFRMELAVRSSEAVVTVHNIGAGHNFPGERHFRVLLLRIDVLDAAGTPVEEYRTVLKDVTPLRMARLEVDIGAGESVTHRYPLPCSAGTVRVRLLYKLYPHVLDSEAKLLAEITKRFPQ